MGQLLKRAWRGFWAQFGNIILIGGWLLSFAIPAWAAHAAKVFVQYTPLSWVAVGFLGLVTYSASVAIWGWGRQRLVRSRYDQAMLAKGGAIDPLAKTFERKRIFLNDFALPSKPIIEGKTFIDCEIVGPANVILNMGNSVTDHQLPVCDALVLAPDADPYNGYVFNHCVFRGCSFVRVTLMFTMQEYRGAKGVNWLRWISMQPSDEPEIPFLLPPEVDAAIDAAHRAAMEGVTSNSDNAAGATDLNPDSKG